MTLSSQKVPKAMSGAPQNDRFGVMASCICQDQGTGEMKNSAGAGTEAIGTVSRRKL